MKQWKGISDPQAKLLEAFFRGDDDGKIASDLGISRSTVRDHRFRIKERARHAKVFLAMMQIPDQKGKPEARLVDFPANSRMTYERYALTRMVMDLSEGAIWFSRSDPCKGGFMPSDQYNEVAYNLSVTLIKRFPASA